MTKRAVCNATRRAVALRHGVEPGSSGHVACWWCGRLGQVQWFRTRAGRPGAWVWFEHQMDHLIPEEDGGPDIPSNVVPACKRCNCRRRFRKLRPAHILIALSGGLTTMSGVLTPGSRNREQGREQG